MEEHATQLAHKLVYLAKEFPKLKSPDQFALLAIPQIDQNIAVWKAQELELIGKPDQYKPLEILNLPATWEFGDAEKLLEDKLEYAFNKASTINKSDLEDGYLGLWLAGYPAHDAIIAMHHLVERGVLYEYPIIDKDKNKYTYYTLTKNKGKYWGQRQFKPGTIKSIDGKPFIKK